MIVSPINGKQLTGEYIRQLITTGRTSLVKVQKKERDDDYEALSCANGRVQDTSGSLAANLREQRSRGSGVFILTFG
jgi:hypothetical protein